MQFSIVMPVYNSAGTLEKSIGSIFVQTYPDWELVVVDDGSTDNSLEILKQISQRDTRIKVFHQENKGPGAARNEAIRHCEGDYIAFLDSDDYWDKSYLFLVKEIIDKDFADVVFTDRVYERQDGSFIKNSHIYVNKGCSKYEILCKQMTGMIPWGMGKVYKKSILDRISTGFAAINVGEEAVFSFDAVSASQKIGFIEQPIYHYVQSPYGQHKKGNLDPWGDVVVSMKQHLDTMNLYKQYELNINSFALRALCLSINRCTLLSPYTKYKETAREKFEEYSAAYDFNSINKDSIDKASLIILLLLKHKMYFAINLAAKLRRKKLAY